MFDLKKHGIQQKIGDGQSSVWSMTVVGGFAALFCNQDSFNSLEIIAEIKNKNVKAEDLKINLKP